MNNLLKKTGFAFLMCVFAFNLSAQTDIAPAHEGKRPKLSPQEKAEKTTEKMTEKMGLTEKQSAEVYQITLKYAELREVNKEKAKADRHVMKNDFNAEMQKVLTPEQYKQFIIAQEKRIERRKERQRRGGRG